MPNIIKNILKRERKRRERFERFQKGHAFRFASSSNPPSFSLQIENASKKIPSFVAQDIHESKDKKEKRKEKKESTRISVSKHAVTFTRPFLLITWLFRHPELPSFPFSFLFFFLPPPYFFLTALPPHFRYFTCRASLFSLTLLLSRVISRPPLPSPVRAIARDIVNELSYSRPKLR